jgi:hypothetical protein
MMARSRGASHAAMRSATRRRVAAAGERGAARAGSGGRSRGGAGGHVPARRDRGRGCRAARPGARQQAQAATGGALLAWGDNEFGQLGNGTTADSTTPIKVKLPVGDKVTEVRAGCGYSLAETSTGRVLAWGGNPDGQLGNGTTADSSLSVRVKFPAGTVPTALGAGPTAVQSVHRAQPSDVTGHWPETGRSRWAGLGVARHGAGH